MNFDTWIRERLASITGDEFNQLNANANLIEHGIHSLHMMRMLEHCQRITHSSLLYAQLAQQPTIAAWTHLLQRHNKADQTAY